MDAKVVVQRGYDLFGSGDMETFFGEVVHNDITWTFPGEVGKHPLAAVSYTHLTLPTTPYV